MLDESPVITPRCRRHARHDLKSLLPFRVSFYIRRGKGGRKQRSSDVIVATLFCWSCRIIGIFIPLLILTESEKNPCILDNIPRGVTGNLGGLFWRLNLNERTGWREVSCCCWWRPCVVCFSGRHVNRPTPQSTEGPWLESPCGRGPGVFSMLLCYVCTLSISPPFPFCLNLFSPNRPPPLKKFSLPFQSTFLIICCRSLFSWSRFKSMENVHKKKLLWRECVLLLLIASRIRRLFLTSSNCLFFW